MPTLAELPEDTDVHTFSSPVTQYWRGLSEGERERFNTRCKDINSLADRLAQQALREAPIPDDGLLALMEALRIAVVQRREQPAEEGHRRRNAKEIVVAARQRYAHLSNPGGVGDFPHLAAMLHLLPDQDVLADEGRSDGEAD